VGPSLDEALARIRERDGEIRAWTQVSPQPALATGPLDGVTFGAKDIFDTRKLRTEYGSPLFAGRHGGRDAALITRLRERGAILVGKTQTTAFAYFDPAPTRNPCNPAHTPGGSSSGSAAAVAAGMVAFALGTQTQGSVVRPASFCGVCGFKPAHGLLPLDGVLPFAPALDTAGLFTQTAEQMRWLWGAMGYDIGASPSAMAALPLPAEVEPAMRECFEQAVSRLGAKTLQPPRSFFDLPVKLINDYEGARTHEAMWRKHGARVGAKLAELIERGLKIPQPDYRRALEALERTRKEMAGLPVLLWPAAFGAAPRGLASTGDPRMNAPFTALGWPAITIPMGRDAAGLPLGLQLAAAPGQEAVLLATACSLA
jgi:Asp-tRNA(Asn)/Glu-tRNA(Gln) amidotransferase A subunit family amidase